MGKRKEILSCLEKALEYYDKVFLFWNSFPQEQEVASFEEGNMTKKELLLKLTDLFYEPQILKKINQRVLLLLPSGVFEIVSNIKKKRLAEADEDQNRLAEKEYFIKCPKIRDDDASFLLDVYYTYEFSDRFSVISFSGQYSSLFHFVDTGLLTLDEMAMALLH